jgi:hypothetical protein
MDGDPSAYLRSLMESARRSAEQFDDPLSLTVGMGDRNAEPGNRAPSSLAFAIEMQRDFIAQPFRLKRHSTGTVPAPELTGNASYTVIEPAPGRYVRMK